MKYKYYVYVFELNDDPRYVYVGQSVHEPEVRLEQHKSGYKSARSIRHCKIGRLRPDIYNQYNPIVTRNEALAHESKLADELRSRGYNVEGGH